MSESPDTEHERVADVLAHLDEHPEVVIEDTRTETGNIFTRCTVTFALREADTDTTEEAD